MERSGEKPPGDSGAITHFFSSSHQYPASLWATATLEENNLPVFIAEHDI